jgi:hypothetical protein
MRSRLFLFLSLAVMAIISLASCTKNYTCHCTMKYSNYPGLPDSSFQEFTITDNKGGAKSKCEAKSGKYTNNNISTLENCYLN